MAPDFNSSSLSMQLDQSSCVHDTATSKEFENSYPNIFSITATLQLGSTTGGTIKANLLDKTAMDALCPAEMWQQCQAYNHAYAPFTKLDKVENFLGNESFPKVWQDQIDDAEWVLYIDEAHIDPLFRRRGYSLLALDLLIRELHIGDCCVVLLQAGSIGRFENDKRVEISDAVDACEKIARHWKRMGFREWSDSDDAWLCLLTGERPKIEGVVPELSRMAAGQKDSEALR